MFIKIIKPDISHSASGCSFLHCRLQIVSVYFVIPFTLSMILLFSGCQASVGKCTYGEAPDQRGKVIITSIEKVYSENQLYYRIKVDGFFKREFIYSSDDFQAKYTSLGYKTGSELDGVVRTGGPCPPMYRISE